MEVEAMKRPSEIPAKMWDDLLEAAKWTTDPFAFRCKAISIGWNYGYTQRDLVDCGIIEKFSPERQTLFNRYWQLQQPVVHDADLIRYLDGCPPFIGDKTPE
jgi:hypothetical protein